MRAQAATWVNFLWQCLIVVNILVKHSIIKIYIRILFTFSQSSSQSVTISNQHGLIFFSNIFSKFTFFRNLLFFSDLREKKISGTRNVKSIASGLTAKSWCWADSRDFLLFTNFWISLFLKGNCSDSEKVVWRWTEQN